MHKQRFFSTSVGRLFRAAPVILATFLSLLVLPSWAQVEDTTAPTVTAFSFTPTSVDTTSGPATVKVIVTVSDDLTGVRDVSLRFYSPSGGQTQLGRWYLTTASLNATGSFDVIIPQYAEAGPWTIYNLFVQDAVGNYRYYQAADLTAKGWPSQLSVAGPQDKTAPTLDAFSFTPTSVDTTGGPATVKVTATVSDDLTGVRDVSVSFYSPSGGQTQLGRWYLTTASFNATGSFDVIIPQYAEAGPWTIYNLFVQDAVGNYRYYQAADLTAKGWPSQLSVAGPQDKTAPTLDAFSFTPTSVDTTGGPATVKVTATVSDDLTGVRDVSVSFYSPSGGQTQLGRWYLTTASLNATGSFDVIIPQYAEAGPWTIYNLFVQDAVGNYRYYQAADLTAKGWPSQLSVGQQDHTPPSTTATSAPTPNVHNWNHSDVTVTFSATDNVGGAGVKQITVDLIGAQTGSGVIAGSTAQVTISAEGATILRYYATDNAGNQETAKTLTVNVDKTPPVISGMPAPGCTIWPPNHKLVHIATVTATDALSGLTSSTVIGTSGDPANGQIIITGGPSQYSVQFGANKDEIYTLTATASDQAGNIATRTAMCGVAHDQVQ